MHQETLKPLKDYLECKDFSNGIWAWMSPEYTYMHEVLDVKE